MQIQLDQTDTKNMLEELKEYAIILCPALGYDTSEVLEEMNEGNQEHLIDIFQKYFGEYIELLNADNVIISRKELPY